MPLPAYNAADHVPAPAPMPTLTVTPKGVLHLHLSLREALGLRDGLPINLVPPNPNTDNYWWHLDLRPTARYRIAWYNNMRMRVRGILLPPGLVTEPLTLHLYTTAPETSHYYPMFAAHALAA